MARQRPPMGDIIRDLRTKHGLTLGALVTKVCMQLPDAYWISDETLRKMETGRITEGDADPLIVDRIADVFGVKVTEISPTAAEQIKVIRDLINRSSAWMLTVADQAA